MKKVKREFTVPIGPDGKPMWPKRPEMTPERLEAIKVLDGLRSGADEDMPDVPLATVVYVKDSMDIPLANEAYALVTVMCGGESTWKVAVRRGAARPRTKMLFVSSDAALPMDERYRNPNVTKCKEKRYRFGVAEVHRLLPHVQRHIYPLNCGVLYPTADFAELKGKRAGLHVAVLLHIDRAEELKLLQQNPHAFALHYQG